MPRRLFLSPFLFLAVASIFSLCFFVSVFAETVGVAPATIQTPPLVPGMTYLADLIFTRGNTDDVYSIEMEHVTGDRAAWLSFSEAPQIPFLEGSKTASFQIPITIPKGTTPGEYVDTVFFVFHKEGDAPKGSVAFETGVSVSIHIMVTDVFEPSFFLHKVEYIEVGVSEEGRPEILVNSQIENKGNKKGKPTRAELSLFDVDLQTPVGRFEFTSFEDIDPFTRSNLVFAFPVSNLGFGNYRGTVVVYSEGSVIASGEQELFFQVPLDERNGQSVTAKRWYWLSVVLIPLLAFPYVWKHRKSRRRVASLSGSSSHLS